MSRALAAALLLQGLVLMHAVGAVSQVSTKLITFVLTLLTARFLSVEGYGVSCQCKASPSLLTALQSTDKLSCSLQQSSST